jgi:predicted RNA-binding Zn ribbon-like protein
MVGGEPLAVELADTVVMVSEPPTDLLNDEGACLRFWELQAARLPAGWGVPSLAATRRLRDAIRQLLDSALHGQLGGAADRIALQTLNSMSCRAQTFSEVRLVRKELCRVERWKARTPGDLAIAAAARSAIAILTEPDERQRLRRCANPNCSMLFVNGDRRRRWCTPNICGNRARVARHYERHRQTDAKTFPAEPGELLEAADVTDWPGRPAGSRHIADVVHSCLNQW